MDGHPGCNGHLARSIRRGFADPNDAQDGTAHVPYDFKLSAYEPNKLLSFKTVSTGTVQWDSDLTFEALSDTSTRLSNSGEIGLRGIWRLFEPLMAGEVKSGEQKELEKVKQILQGS